MQPIKTNSTGCIICRMGKKIIFIKLTLEGRSSFEYTFKRTVMIYRHIIGYVRESSSALRFI